VLAARCLELGTKVVDLSADFRLRDAALYQRVYEAVLRHRNGQVVAIGAILPTERLSVYDFAEPVPDLVPTEADAERVIREVERRYPDPAELDAEVARWWQA
jgi:hypothetical protein